MTDNQKRFLRYLSLEVKQHADWLVLMRFGLSQLLQDQPILIEAIITESKREGCPILSILSELNLKLTTIE